MSVDRAIRDMIRDEVEAAIAPLAQVVAQIQNQGGVLAQLSAVLGGQKRGPGRPPNPFKLARPSLRLTAGTRESPRTLSGASASARALSLSKGRRALAQLAGPSTKPLPRSPGASTASLRAAPLSVHGNHFISGTRPLLPSMVSYSTASPSAE